MVKGRGRSPKTQPQLYLCLPPTLVPTIPHLTYMLLFLSLACLKCPMLPCSCVIAHLLSHFTHMHWSTCYVLWTVLGIRVMAVNKTCGLGLKYFFVLSIFKNIYHPSRPSSKSSYYMYLSLKK